MQFNDVLASASLNETTNWKEECEPNSMVRRHIVRGFNEQIYFAETTGNTDKIFKFE